MGKDMFRKTVADGTDIGQWSQGHGSRDEDGDWEYEYGDWEGDDDSWEEGWYYEESTWLHSLHNLLPVMFVLIVWCVLAGIAITNHCAGRCTLF